MKVKNKESANVTEKNPPQNQNKRKTKNPFKKLTKKIQKWTRNLKKLRKKKVLQQIPTTKNKIKPSTDQKPPNINKKATDLNSSPSPSFDSDEQANSLLKNMEEIVNDIIENDPKGKIKIPKPLEIIPEDSLEGTMEVLLKKELQNTLEESEEEFEEALLEKELQSTLEEVEKEFEEVMPEKKMQSTPEESEEEPKEVIPEETEEESGEGLPEKDLQIILEEREEEETEEDLSEEELQIIAEKSLKEDVEEVCEVSEKLTNAGQNTFELTGDFYKKYIYKLKHPKEELTTQKTKKVEKYKKANNEVTHEEEFIPKRKTSDKTRWKMITPRPYSFGN